MSYIYQALSLAIDFFYRLTGNYGWAIIILSILFSLITAPVLHLQLKTTQRTAEFSKMQKEIEKRYKGDKKRAQDETMRMMKQQGYNPLSGCLPMLIQVFLMWAFFGALRTLQYTAAPSFYWVPDLAKPDLWILPILVGITTFLRSKLTTPPSTGDPSQKMQMQLLVYIMPLFIAYMSRQFPAGLALYWVVANAVSILQQLIYPAGGRQPQQPQPGGSSS